MSDFWWGAIAGGLANSLGTWAIFRVQAWRLRRQRDKLRRARNHLKAVGE